MVLHLSRSQYLEFYYRVSWTVERNLQFHTLSESLLQNCLKPWQTFLSYKPGVMWCFLLILSVSILHKFIKDLFGLLNTIYCIILSKYSPELCNVMQMTKALLDFVLMYNLWDRSRDRNFIHRIHFLTENLEGKVSACLNILIQNWIKYVYVCLCLISSLVYMTSFMCICVIGRIGMPPNTL